MGGRKPGRVTFLPLEIFSQQLKEPDGRLSGVLPAARPLLLAALALRSEQPLLCLCASAGAAERLVDDLASLLEEQGEEQRALLFPESEMSLFDQGESDPDRLRVLHALSHERPLLVVASLLAFLQPVPAPKRLRRRVLKVGDELDRDQLVETLVSWEYRQADLVREPGDLARREHVTDLFPSNGAPLRLRTEGDTIVSMRSFSAETQRSLEELASCEILPMVEPEGKEALIDYFSEGDRVILIEPEQLRERLDEMASAAESGWKFSAYKDVEILADARPDDWEQVEELLACRPRLEVLEQGDDLCLEPVPGFDSLSEFARWAGARPAETPLTVLTQHPHRLAKVLSRKGVEGATVLEGTLGQGVSWPGRFDLVTDRELFGVTSRHRLLTSRESEQDDLGFGEGDLVVHAERGIGRFVGLFPVDLEGSRRDLIKLEYANEHTLLVPPEQIDRLSPYQTGKEGGEDDAPSLSRLDTEAWQKSLARARTSVLETVAGLQRQRDKRKRQKATPIGPDLPEQEELEAAFPYDETPSQLAAIERIKADLERKTAMDRLLCGDVGYGKTEVAIRAAFKAVSHGFQAALLAPTTVLAQQHFEDFLERMEPLGVKVRGLWSDAEDAEETLAGLASGDVKMVVGTHSLLSESVSFAKLGLLVVDEEQSFGVAHKERLGALSKGVHVLSMSATPIPRTMQLALAGVRDISLLDAPPEARRPIRTYLLVEKKNLVAAALMRELERGGQAFLLHNRVEELPALAEEVEKLVPGARVAVAHGQMQSGALESTLADFEERKFDVLVCSTIIEAGIDFPNVNTIVIKDAHRFGLSQLYQIRGRVGRAGRQAYCYLMVPRSEDLNEKARLRLETISSMTGLGSGYQIALTDLRIRGAGDLLGGEQSGEIARLGYTLYSHLLAESLGEGGEEQAERPALEIPSDACLPPEYIPPLSLRIAIYRRLASVRKAAALDHLVEELEDRFGPLPASVENLLLLTRLRLIAQTLEITSVKVEEQFGERTVRCRGARDEIVLTKPPKGPALLAFVIEGLEAL